MKINCPICSTEIDVDAANAGCKGRCMDCGSKLIIPSNPDDFIEILEHGSPMIVGSYEPLQPPHRRWKRAAEPVLPQQHYLQRGELG